MADLPYFSEHAQRVLVVLVKADQKGRRLSTAEVRSAARVNNASPTLRMLRRRGLAYLDAFGRWFIDPEARALMELGAALSVGLLALSKRTGGGGHE